MHKVKVIEKYGYRQLDPVPRSDELSKFYESQYYHLIRNGGRAPHIRKMLEGGDVAHREREWLRSVMFRDIAETLASLIFEGANVLDIGAGTGDFVAFMAECGYRAEGIEPATEPSESAREIGLAIHTADLASWAGDQNNYERYDAVVMVNVLEHVPDPESVVEQSMKLLRPGGVLVIRVPNDFTEIQKATQEKLNKDVWWVFAPDHINYFSVESLRRFLGAFNLDVEVEMTDFPMEMFLLMGDDYIGDSKLGSVVHQKRCNLELAMSSDFRRKLYTALASVGIGRNITTFARKCAPA